MNSLTDTYRENLHTPQPGHHTRQPVLRLPDQSGRVQTQGAAVQTTQVGRRHPGQAPRVLWGDRGDRTLNCGVMVSVSVLAIAPQSDGGQDCGVLARETRREVNRNMPSGDLESATSLTYLQRDNPGDLHSTQLPWIIGASGGGHCLALDIDPAHIARRKAPRYCRSFVAPPLSQWEGSRAMVPTFGTRKKYISSSIGATWGSRGDHLSI